jgi:FMN reductase
VAGEERQLRVVGIGGTLREKSTSLWAVQRALRAAEAAGAVTEELDIRALELALYNPDQPLDSYGANVTAFLDTIQQADGLIWSTEAHHGTLAGVTKNALDFLEFLADSETPYLRHKVVGLIATANSDLGAVNAVHAMMDVAHALRALVVPLYVPISRAQHVFGSRGNVRHEAWASQLDQLGEMTVEIAAQCRLSRVRRRESTRMVYPKFGESGNNDR